MEEINHLEFEMEYLKIIKYFEDKNPDTINLNQTEMKQNIEIYIEENPNARNMFEKLKTIFEKNLEKNFRIGISGVAGLGKSELLNNLFGVEFPISRFGTGTLHQITKKMSIAFLNLIIDDLQGLGDEQKGYETTFDNNNHYIRSQLINNNSILIQSFDFNSNRVTHDEKIQLKNIFNMIDFTKPEKEYLKIVSKFCIIFLRANLFISNEEVMEKIIEINNFINDEISLSERLSQEHEIKLNNIFNEINELFENQYKLQIYKIKNQINEILYEKVKSPILRQRIIDNISFTYSGNNNKITKKPNEIPLRECFHLKFKQLKNYKYNPWCENWRYDIFNKIIHKLDESKAYSLNLAIKERGRIIQEKNADPHKINEADINNYLNLDKTANSIIEKGTKKVIFNFMSEATALFSSSGTSYWFLNTVATKFGLSMLSTASPIIALGFGFFGFYKQVTKNLINDK